MAKVIEYDVSGVEESSGGTGVKVKPGVHPAKIVRARHRTEKKDGSPANDIEVALSFGDEYDWGFTYIGLGDAADWKLAEFVRALGLKDKGKLDPEKLEGKIIRVKVNNGTYNDEYSPDMGKLMKAQDGDEELIGQSVSEMSGRGGDGPDAAGDAGSDAGEFVEKTYSNAEFVPSRETLPDGSQDPEVGSYDDWSDEDLESEVADRELTLPGGRASKRNKMLAALRAEDEEVYADFNAGGDPTPDDQAQAEAGAGDDDYESWDIDQLKTEWEARQMGDLPAIRGRNAADRLKEAIIEAIRQDDAENPFQG